MSNPFKYLSELWPWSIDDWSPDWDEREDPPPDSYAGQILANDAADAKRDREGSAIARIKPGETPTPFPVVSVEKRAKAAKYPNGKIKRTRYRRVNLAKRKVVIGLHQAGVERGEARWGKSVHRVTCHRAIGPTGTRYRVHPLDTRIVCTNRFDRKPWHCIGIEQLGNMEGNEGQGNWYKPDTFGYGTFSLAEEESLLQECAAICTEVEAMGAKVYGIVWHRISGKNKKKKPNRPLCPGSAIVQRVGMRVAIELGLKIPGPDQSFGGTVTPTWWYGGRLAEARRLGLVGL